MKPLWQSCFTRFPVFVLNAKMLVFTIVLVAKCSVGVLITMYVNVNAAYPTLNTKWWFIRSLCQLAGDWSVSLAAPSIKSFCVCQMYDREAWGGVKTHDGRHSSWRFSCEQRHVFRQWLWSNGLVPEVKNRRNRLRNNTRLVEIPPAGY